MLTKTAYDSSPCDIRYPRTMSGPRPKSWEPLLHSIVLRKSTGKQSKKQDNGERRIVLRIYQKTRST
ncbi:hypothetical protein AVEN_41329-1, partial [Araneus ventricosus]